MSELIDNKAHRVRELKTIIKHLHEGQPAEQVKGKLVQIVKQTDYSEIMAMEQELIAEGMPVEEVRSMCDLHSQVTREIMVNIPRHKVAPGHPIDTFRRENVALREVVGRMREVIAELNTLPADGALDGGLLFRFRQSFNDLMDIEKHYQRKEHALFSFLEKHGILGPSKVMWGKDDDVRAMLKELGSALHGQNLTVAELKAAASLAARALAAVEEMIHKEENILFPTAMDTLTEDEWGEIWAASPKYGWCLVEPQQGYVPPIQVMRKAVDLPKTEAIMMPTGNATLEQLVAVFSTMPVDLTFVDADDRVAFFTEGPERIFARSKAIIGRKVQHCHPPRSVEVVDRILEDFRAGRQNVAEFWINFQGRYVHIRYFAVRDKDGGYMGTLELTQDITRIKALEGERRLLEYS